MCQLYVKYSKNSFVNNLLKGTTMVTMIPLCVKTSGFIQSFSILSLQNHPNRHFGDIPVFHDPLLISILIWVGLSVTFGAGVEVLEHDADDARGQFEAQQGTSRAGSLGGSAGNWTDSAEIYLQVMCVVEALTGAWQVALVGYPEAWHGTYFRFSQNSEV